MVHYYKDGVEVFQSNTLTIIDIDSSLYDEIAIDIIGENTGDYPISNMLVDSAGPIQFKNALPSLSKSLNVGETKTLWISDRINVLELGGLPQPIKFWVNISGESPYVSGKIYYYVGQEFEIVTTCTESWTCTDYGSCSITGSPGTKTRICTDSNSCGTIDDRPLLSTSCCIPLTCADFGYGTFYNGCTGNIFCQEPTGYLQRAWYPLGSNERYIASNPNYVWVSHHGGDISKYSHNGAYLQTWDGYQYNPGALSANTNYIYWGDAGGHEITRYNAYDGATGRRFLDDIRDPGDVVGLASTDTYVYSSWDNTNNVYRTDLIGHYDTPFGSSTMLSRPKSVDANNNYVYILTSDNRIWRWVPAGNAYYGFWYVNGGTMAIAVNDDYVYTADNLNKRIYKYSHTGAYITYWTVSGTTDFMDITAEGDYVYLLAVSGSPRVYKYKS